MGIFSEFFAGLTTNKIKRAKYKFENSVVNFRKNVKLIGRKNNFDKICLHRTFI